MSAQQGLSPTPPRTRPRHLRVRRDEVVRRGVRDLRRIAPWIQQTDLIQARNLIQLEWIQRRLFEEIRRCDVFQKENGTGGPAQAQRLWRNHGSPRVSASRQPRQGLKSSTANAALDLAAMMAQPPDPAEALMIQHMDEGETARPKGTANPTNNRKRSI